MAVAGYWSLGNLARGACDVGFDYAKSMVSSTLSRAYSYTDRAVRCIKHQVEMCKEKTVACAQEKGIISQAAQTAITAALILSEFREHNYSAKQLLENSAVGIIAAYMYFGGENTQIDQNYIILMTSLISTGIFLYLDNKKFTGKTGKAIHVIFLTTGVVFLSSATLMVSAIAHRLYQPLIPPVTLVCILGSKYALEKGRFTQCFPEDYAQGIEWAGKIAVGMGSIKGTTLLRDKMIESPIVAAISTISLFACSERWGNASKHVAARDDGNKILGLIGVSMVTQAAVSKSSLIENVCILASSQIAGFFIGAVYPELKDKNFWKTKYKRIQHCERHELIIKYQLRCLSPELVNIINDYLFRKPQTVKTDTALSGTFMRYLER